MDTESSHNAMPIATAVKNVSVKFSPLLSELSNGITGRKVQYELQLYALQRL